MYLKYIVCLLVNVNLFHKDFPECSKTEKIGVDLLRLFEKSHAHVFKRINNIWKQKLSLVIAMKK